ncbi:MAG: hypothetical protein PHZ00_05545 [Candidatus Peribacteraceae bacterium]|nr:hypothetical protein [Candidatus Peribacteraceae bacterium]
MSPFDSAQSDMPLYTFELELISVGSAVNQSKPVTKVSEPDEQEYSQRLAQKRQASMVTVPSPHCRMRPYQSSFPAARTDRRFSGALQSWFPAIHWKTFPETALHSAVRRTTYRS